MSRCMEEWIHEGKAFMTSQHEEQSDQSPSLPDLSLVFFYVSLSDLITHICQFTVCLLYYSITSYEGTLLFFGLLKSPPKTKSGNRSCSVNTCWMSGWLIWKGNVFIRHREIEHWALRSNTLGPSLTQSPLLVSHKYRTAVWHDRFLLNNVPLTTWKHWRSPVMIWVIVLGTKSPPDIFFFFKKNSKPSKRGSTCTISRQFHVYNGSLWVFFVFVFLFQCHKAPIFYLWKDFWSQIP